jgi:hypothetical protein
MVGSLGSHPGTRDFSPALDALVGSVQNTYYSLYSILLRLSSMRSKLGKKWCRVACLFIQYVSLHDPYDYTHAGESM